MSAFFESKLHDYLQYLIELVGGETFEYSAQASRFPLMWARTARCAVTEAISLTLSMALREVGKV